MPEGPIGTKANDNTDPERIQPFVTALGQLWATTPEVRFGHFLGAVIVSFRPRDLLDAEDEDVIKHVQRSIARAQEQAAKDFIDEHVKVVEVKVPPSRKPRST